VTVQHAFVTDAAGVAAMQLRGPIPLGGSTADISSWPRLILFTSMGDVLVILSPRDAPDHVKLLEQLVDSGAYNGASLGRVDPQSYVQWFAPDATTSSSVLPVEHGSVGNVASALTIDSRDAERVPALTFLLTDNHTLDGRYTAVGWVTAGSDVLNALAHVPTGSDHRPRRAITLERATIVTGGAPIVLRGLTSQSTGTDVPTAVFGLIAGATAMGLAIFLLAKRLPPTVIASLALLVVLLGFFALWVGLVPRTAISSQWLSRRADRCPTRRPRRGWRPEPGRPQSRPRPPRPRRSRPPIPPRHLRLPPGPRPPRLRRRRGRTATSRPGPVRTAPARARRPSRR
jgi:cyclophilin family peptidyl-prolyl cis-trans isomerase